MLRNLISMNIDEIRESVKNKNWYYYYNFDGIEVRPQKKNNKALGMYNWDRLKPIVKNTFSMVDNPMSLMWVAIWGYMITK